MASDIEKFFQETFSKPTAITAEDIQEVRNRLSEAPYAMMTTIERAQFRAAVETIDSIRKFDEASARLVETTNNLTRKGLVLSAAALVVAAASLLVSAIAIVK